MSPPEKWSHGTIDTSSDELEDMISEVFVWLLLMLQTVILVSSSNSQTNANTMQTGAILFTSYLRQAKDSVKIKSQRVGSL